MRPPAAGSARLACDELHAWMHSQNLTDCRYRPLTTPRGSPCNEIAGPRIVASTRSQRHETISARNRRTLIIATARRLRRTGRRGTSASSYRLLPAAPPTRPRRLYAEALSQAFGKQFVVENRPGGGGIPVAEARSRAEPDGYTLMMSGHSDHRGRPDDEQERRLRSDARPYPHRLFRRHAEHAHDAFIAWPQGLCRIHRLCAEATLRHRLCLRRSRHHGQLERRVSRDAREHQTQPYRLQRRLAGDRRSHRWPREGGRADLDGDCRARALRDGSMRWR